MVALVVVATVKVELAPDVTEVGLKEVVTPAGAPVMVRATVCAYPGWSRSDGRMPGAARRESPLAGAGVIEKSLTPRGRERDRRRVRPGAAVPVTVSSVPVAAPGAAVIDRGRADPRRDRGRVQSG